MELSTTDLQSKRTRFGIYTHLRALEDGITSIEAAEGKTGWSIGYPGWSMIFCTLLSHLDPKGENTLFETDPNWGASTIVLTQALLDFPGEGHFHTIEIGAELTQKAGEPFDKVGVTSMSEVQKRCLLT